MKRASNSLAAPIIKILFWLLILTGATIVFFRLLSRLPNEIPTTFQTPLSGDDLPTPTVTAEGQAPQSPVPSTSAPNTGNPSVLFNEDFEDGKAQQVWNILGDWKVIEDETGNQVYDIDNSKNAEGPCIDFGSSSWGDYVIKYRFRVLDNGAGSWTAIAFRRNHNRMAQYIFSIDLYNVGLHYSGLDGQWHNKKNRSYPLNKNTWYWVRVEANGTNLDIFIDGFPVINTEDTLYSTGTLELCGGPYSHAQFDDIEVTTVNK
jgi:hypothetical protein